VTESNPFETDEERYERQHREERERRQADETRFHWSIDILVASMSPEIWNIGDGYGGWALDEIRSRLEAKMGAAPKRPTKARVPGFTASHKLLHRLGERDGWTCSYCFEEVGCACASDVDVRQAAADHVFPKCRGGEDDDSNRVLACRSCNSSKGDRTPEEWGGP
jgi:hypothetical protein